MTAINKLYVLSSEFDYNVIVSPCTGPDFARRMSLPCTTFDDVRANIAGLRDYWLIIDTRMTDAESVVLGDVIRANPEVRFVLDVIDPGNGHMRRRYYQLLLEVAREPNAWFMTPYVPNGVVAELDRASGGRRLAVIPYPYQEDVERPLGGERRRQIILSGAQNRAVYPLRRRMKKLAQWHPLVARQVSRLPHPGYPDVGQIKKHDIIGHRYVEHLAGFTHMFVCSSIFRLEFLKYGECAAAGCVPVGERPYGFEPDMAEPFFELDFSGWLSLARSIRNALQMPADEVEDRARRYRDAYRRHRNATVLNQRLDDFLRSASTAA